jgi:RimJ/RimL family protein N-acetyltransferase
VLTDVVCDKGTYHLHLIASEIPGNGNAQHVLNEFLAYVKACVTLSVRKDNERAIKFYEKNGFKYIGSIDWKQGEVKGVVYRKDEFE